MADSLHFTVRPDPDAAAYWWRVDYEDGPSLSFSTPDAELALPNSFFPVDTLSTLQVQTVRRIDLEASGWSEPLHLVSEPAAGLLLVAGLVGLALMGRWRR